MYSLSPLKLKPQTRAALEQALPRCYSEPFHYCMDDERRSKPQCAKYEPVHLAFEEDTKGMEKIIEDMPLCEVSKRDTRLVAAAAMAGGFVAGLAIAFALR